MTKTRRRTCCGMLLILTAAVMGLAAAEIAGNWTGAIVSGTEDDHPIPLFLDLKVDGGKVTGAIGPDENRRFPLDRAELVGNRLTFHAVAPNQGTIACELTVESAALRGTARFTNMADGQTREGKVEFKRP